MYNRDAARSFRKMLKYKNAKMLLSENNLQLNTDTKLWPISKSLIVKEVSPRAYFQSLESSFTSKMEHVCKNSERLLAVNYFCLIEKT